MKQIVILKKVYKHTNCGLLNLDLIESNSLLIKLLRKIISSVNRYVNKKSNNKS